MLFFQEKPRRKVSLVCWYCLTEKIFLDFLMPVLVHGRLTSCFFFLLLLISILAYLHPPDEPQLRRKRSWIDILIHITTIFVVIIVFFNFYLIWHFFKF